jgi:murein DD-endopeptidase MepM/ murein hydrolase activator NlpD
LPYNTGSEYEVLQTFNGTISHHSPRQHAVDFEMPTGDKVCAARKGIVVEIEDSKSGTSPVSKKDPGNFVRILHDDRTYGYYIHLEQHSIMVSEGDSVSEDDEIANSDHTGSSTEPHLHFDVRKANGTGGWKTVPWKFKKISSTTGAFIPVKGTKYKKEY